MLFLTAASMGICVGLMRSAFAIAGVAVLIAATFALAIAVSPGPLSCLNLLVAILGYNAGLIALLVGLFALHVRRPAPGL